MRPTALHAVFLGFLPHLSTAQSSTQGTQNPMTAPACATMLSIALSCESKFTDLNPVTASIYNCLCFDNSGNYVPSVYDNAVAGCASESGDQITDLDFWMPGFCTNTEYATETAAGMSTTGGDSPTIIGLTGIPTVTSTGGGGVSSSPTATQSPKNPSSATNPGGLISSTSNPTPITPAPTSPSSSATGVVVGVSSTTSKAGGMKTADFFCDGILMSILGPILGAVFLL